MRDADIKIRALARLMNEFFRAPARIAAERAPPRLRRRVKNFQLADFTADRFGRTQPQQIRERAIQAQHAPGVRRARR